MSNGIDVGVVLTHALEIDEFKHACETVRGGSGAALWDVDGYDKYGLCNGAKYSDCWSWDS